MNDALEPQPDNPHWIDMPEPQPGMTIAESPELVNGETTLAGMLFSAVLGLMMLVTFIQGLVDGFATTRLVVFGVTGAGLLGWAAFEWYRYMLRRQYRLLHSGIECSGPDGVGFIARERVDQVLARRIADNSGPAAELLLTNGEWVQLNVTEDFATALEKWVETGD
jgi:hypothetical protein